MKICIPSMGPKLDAMIDPRFGRCQFLLFVDSEENKIIESIPNDNLTAMRGAGIAVSQVAVDKGAEAVIAGNIGPNAFGVLKSAGVKIYSGISSLTVGQALEKFQKEELKETVQPTAMGQGGGGGMGQRGSGMGRGNQGMD